MRKHIFIIFLTMLIIVSEVILIIISIKNNDEEIAFRIVLMVLFAFYPTGFYTCYRLICKDDIKGKFLGLIITSVFGGTFGGVFLIPLLVSPLLFADYIYIFIIDFKKYLWNKKTSI